MSKVLIITGSKADLEWANQINKVLQSFEIESISRIALELIKQSNCPIAAPNANKFGQLSPVNAHHVKKQLPNVDYVLDGGNTSVGIESTIVSIEGNTCQLLRPVFITLDDIEKALPNTFVFNNTKQYAGVENSVCLYKCSS